MFTLYVGLCYVVRCGEVLLKTRIRAVYTGDRYALPVHTARTYGPYVRVSKMHPYIRAVNTARIYGCWVHTTRIELLFCTGRIYRPYIRVTGTHYP